MTRGGDEGKLSVSIQATGSDHSRLSVVGEGALTSIENQTNIYGEQQDPDIHVDLVDELELIDVVIGRPRYVRVEITNLGSTSRELSLRVIGVTASVGRVEPALVQVTPGGHAAAKVVLLCTSAEPLAGKRRLQVRATDNKAGVFKHSNEKTIDVPANAKLVTHSIGQPESMADSQQMIIGVHNLGNTDLHASLKYPDDEWIDRGSSSEYVVRRHELSCGTGVDLVPGQEGHITVELHFSHRPLRDRNCLVPLLVKADRNDASYPNTFTYVQPGLLSELAPMMTAAQTWLRRRMGRLYEWGGDPVTAKRGLLLVMLVPVLALGLLIGYIVSPAPDAEAGSIAPVTTSSSRDPLAPPEFQPVYKNLPCSPGTAVVFIVATKDQKLAKAMDYLGRYHIWLFNAYKEKDVPKLDDQIYFSEPFSS